MRRTVALVVIASIALAGCGQASPSSGPTPSGSAPSSFKPSALPTPTAVPPSPSPSSIAASPTGRIAYIRPEEPNGNGQVDVYLVDATGGTPTRLTNDARIEAAIYWLRDGSRLVYAWSSHADPYHQRLTSVRPDGSDPQDLGPAQTTYSPPAVSPDGRFIAFSGDGTEDGGSGIVLLDLVGGTRLQLTTHGETSAVWSPDGTRLVAYLPSRALMVVDAATGHELARIVDPGVDGLYGWTADGRSVVYHSCVPDFNKPDCMAAPPLAADADGTHVRQYTGPLPGLQDSVAFALRSPDGRWTLTTGDGCSLIVVPVAGGSPVAVGKSMCVAELASWAPDSNWVVFVRPATDPADVAQGLSGGLVVVRRDGGETIQLTDGAYDQAPAWGL